jgi:osmotically-inducible protein OsmY
MERLGQPAFQETAESRAKLEALRKEAQVRSAVSGLAGKSALGGHFVDVILDNESNEITLRGAVPTREDKERAEQAVLAVQWVSKVNNELRAIASFQLGRE